MIQYFLVIDVETEGLPLDWEASLEDFDNWPGIIEIAWQVFNNNRELLNEETIIIQPTGECLSEEVESLTGITFDYAIENGIPLISALKKLTIVLNTFNPIIVAHNCAFDINVIQSSLLKCNIELSLDLFEQICTMQQSIEFCDLPNLKYPKLEELYEILFGSPPDKSHRALSDVQSTSKSFFKLLDSSVITIVKQKALMPIDIETLKDEQICKAIDEYIADLNKDPLFYDLKYINQLNKKNGIIEEVLDGFNEFYHPSTANTFEIPYNQIVNRQVIALKLVDVIIRYILRNYLRDCTNFISSNERYNERAILEFFEGEIEQGRQIAVKVDINNCYESISHDKLISVLSNALNINENSKYLTVFKNALNVIYKNDDGRVLKKEAGLLIGSNPDIFFAEFFLDQVENTIKKTGIDVFRVADEFTYFSDNISSAREIFIKIQNTIKSFGLSVNKSKTSIKDHRKDALDQKIVLLGGVIEGSYGAAFDYSITSRKESRHAKENLNINVSECDSNHTDKDFNVDSYESAIIFLKHMHGSYSAISGYQGKHPKYMYFHNIVFSQPTDFRDDYLRIDMSLFTKRNIEKLRQVIFYFPRSEFYSAMAIHQLVFAATNSVFVSDHSPLEKSNPFHENVYDLHETCELSNLTILEILESIDIHDYQKYLLLRTMFKKKNELDLDLYSYEVQSISLMMDYGTELPFEDQVLVLVNKLAAKTKYYPLSMICEELIAKQKKRDL